MEEQDWHSPGNSDLEDEIGNSRYKARACLKITKKKKTNTMHMLTISTLEEAEAEGP